MAGKCSLCNMPEQSNIERAADRLWQAAQTGVACQPIRDLLGVSDLSAAYAAQQINTDRKIKAGQQVVGCKIGLTSEAVQRQLSVDQPDFGILTDAMEVENGGTIAWDQLMQPKVEAEIAFVLSHDLDSDSISMDELIQSIDCACSCIEVVGSRIEAWNIRLTDTIADNASASHFVMGSGRMSLDQTDLINCRMTLRKNGEIASSGTGRACLGNPLNAALWLARTMQGFGTPLRAGGVILAGALGPMVVGLPGDFYEAEIDGLGLVSVSFGNNE